MEVKNNMSIATGVAVAGIASAGYGAYSASQGSGQSRNAGQEFAGMPFNQFQGQIGDLANQQFDLYKRTANLDLEMYPQFAEAQRRSQAQSAKQILQLYPRFTAAERGQTSLQRGADLGDLGKYGASYAGILGQLSPGYAALDAQTQAPNREILDALHGQAMDQLNSHGALSADEERAIAQASRTAAVDRGLEYSNPALATEALNRDAAVRGRVGENAQFASGVQNMEQAAAGNRINQLLAISQAKLNPILGAMTRTGVSPTIAMGPAQLAPSVGLPSEVFHRGPQVGDLSGALGPLYNYSSDLYNTNFNAAEARALNGANAATSTGGGLLSLSGSLYANRDRGNGGGGGGGYGGGIYG